MKKLKYEEEPKEVQSFLADWLRNTVKIIDKAVKEQLILHGQDNEVREGRAKVVHNLQRGLVQGHGQFTYAIEKNGHLTNILTVEFTSTGFRMFAEKKSKVIKANFRLQKLN